MDNKFHFPNCDCQFDIVGEKYGRKLIQFTPDINAIPLDCPRTWRLISSGNTLGVFQLETKLGMRMAQSLKPENIAQLSALIAIMRPGPLEGVIDGKTIARRYIDRKNHKEEVTVYHPALEPILKDTYQVLIYQEQILQIAKEIAGFTGAEAESFRKSFAKKDPQLMSEYKDKFINGCDAVGKINHEQAEEIFGWIHKSIRYLFNASHSLTYSLNSYLTAYVKAHFPKVFFTSYLHYAKEQTKPHEEVKELVNNARLLHIEILPPDIRYRNRNFALIHNTIYAGFSNIKGMGASNIDKLYRVIADVETTHKPIAEWTWMDFLLRVSQQISSTVAKGLICCGAVDYFRVPRNRMLYEYDQFSLLKEREQNWILAQYTDQTLLTLMKSLASVPPKRTNNACSSVKRVDAVVESIRILENPPFSLNDSSEWIAGIEEEYLGIALSCSTVDSGDKSAVNAECRDFVNGYTRPGPVIIAAKVDRVSEYKIKKGDNKGKFMAFMDVSDITGNLSVTIFTNTWNEYKHLLFVDNNVLLVGGRGDKKEHKDSFLLKKVHQL